MKIKAMHIPQAASVLDKIVNENRPLPSKGKYRIGRLFPILAKEAETLEKQRGDLIRKFGEEIFEKDVKGEFILENGVKKSSGWQVPQSKMDEFTKEWTPVIEMEIEISGEPIPLSCLEMPAQVEIEVDERDSQGKPTGKKVKKFVDPISVQEFLLLGDFVVDDSVESKPNNPGMPGK